MSWFSDIFSTGGNVIGSAISGITSLIGGEEANSSAKEIASANNQTSIDLANTAHQREVADLKAAGLNPILSATGGNGASVPSLTTAPVQNTLTGIANSAQGLATNIADTAVKMAQADNISADTANKRVNNALLSNQVTGSDIYNKLQSTELAYRDPSLWTELEQKKTALNKADLEVLKGQVDLSRSKVGLQLDQLQTHSALAAANMADIDSKYYLTAAGQLLRRLQLGGQAVSDVVKPAGSALGLFGR